MPMSTTGARKISHLIGKNDFENRGDAWHHTHFTSFDDLCDAWCEVMVVLVQYHKLINWQIHYYTSASKRTISDAVIPVKPNSSIRFTGQTDVLAKLSQEAIRLMPKFLPLTKMKVCWAALIFNTWLTPLAVYDGGPHGGHHEAPRGESMLPHSNLYVSLLILLLQTLVILQWAGCLFLVSDYLIEKGIVHVK